MKESHGCSQFNPKIASIFSPVTLCKIHWKKFWSGLKDPAKKLTQSWDWPTFNLVNPHWWKDYTHENNHQNVYEDGWCCLWYSISFCVFDFISNVYVKDKGKIVVIVCTTSCYGSDGWWFESNRRRNLNANNKQHKKRSEETMKSVTLYRIVASIFKLNWQWIGTSFFRRQWK